MSVYGYRDITDVTLFDTTTGNPVTFIDYLQTNSQTYGNEIVYALAGRGAPKRVGFQAKNDLKLDITAGLLSPEMLSIMFGTGVTVGSQNVPVTQKITATTNVFTLSATPVVGATTPITVAYAPDGSNPKVNLTSTVSATPLATEFNSTGITITVSSSTYSSGGTFIVTYSKASTASNKRVKFQADKFTASYKVTGYTLWKNAVDQKLYPCRITIPLLQIEINGSQLASAMDGNPTAFKFSGQALTTPTSNDLIYYDIDEGEIVG